MTDLELSWFGPVLAEDFTFFQVLKVANSYFRPAGFTPVGDDSAGHMLEVIIIEKNTLQVVEDYIDGSVGGIPDLGIVGAPGCINPDQHESLFKVGDTGLTFSGNFFVDFSDPMIFQRTGQLLPRRQGLPDQQRDHAFGFSLGVRCSFHDRLSLCGTKMVCWPALWA